MTLPKGRPSAAGGARPRAYEARRSRGRRLGGLRTAGRSPRLATTTARRARRQRSGASRRNAAVPAPTAPTTCVGDGRASCSRPRRTPDRTRGRRRERAEPRRDAVDADRRRRADARRRRVRERAREGRGLVLGEPEAPPPEPRELGRLADDEVVVREDLTGPASRDDADVPRTLAGTGSTRAVSSGPPPRGPSKKSPPPGATRGSRTAAAGGRRRVSPRNRASKRAVFVAAWSPNQTSSGRTSPTTLMMCRVPSTDVIITRGASRTCASVCTAASRRPRAPRRAR